MVNAYKAGKVADFKEREAKLVDANGLTVGVYKHHGSYYAYLNRCPHQGGPACEGAVAANSEYALGPDKSRREFLSTERFNIACPWHAVEYDLETGICKPDGRFRLVKVEVEVVGDEVMVKI